MDYKHSQLIAIASARSTNSYELCIQINSILYLDPYAKHLFVPMPSSCTNATPYLCPRICLRRRLCPCPSMPLLVSMPVPNESPYLMPIQMHMCNAQCLVPCRCPCNFKYLWLRITSSPVTIFHNDSLFFWIFIITYEQ